MKYRKYKENLYILLSCFIYLVSSDISVKLKNDGPALLGTPITFNASVSEEVGNPFNYHFIFNDDMNIMRRTIIGDSFAEVDFIYNGSIDPNLLHTMNVSVMLFIGMFPLWNVGQAQSKFKLSNDLTVFMEIDQEGLPKEAKQNFQVSTEKPTKIVANLYDHKHFLENITYIWLVNDKKLEANEAFIFYNFTDKANYNISTFVSGVLKTTNATHQGVVKQSISSLDPLKGITVTGATIFERNSSLDIKIELKEGTPPFWHCQEILASCKMELPCQRPIISENVSYPIEKYFRQKGKFCLKVKAGNNISVVEEEFIIDVKDFIKQPQLSVIIVPLVCSILALVIVVFGMAYHVNHREQFTIETADFDFLKNNTDDLIEKTFFERLRDTFLTQLRHFYTCQWICFWNNFNYSEPDDPDLLIESEQEARINVIDSIAE